MNMSADCNGASCERKHSNNLQMVLDHDEHISNQLFKRVVPRPIQYSEIDSKKEESFFKRL